jgi:hypothetical protein
MWFARDTARSEIGELIQSGRITLSGRSDSKDRLYGRDLRPNSCPGGRRLIQGTRDNRATSPQVFFENEADALRHGFRPCGACNRALYGTWKAADDKDQWIAARLLLLESGRIAVQHA